MKQISRLVDSMRRHSIRTKILIGFLITVISMLAINISTILSTQNFLREYHSVTLRISSANQLIPLMREQIADEAYYLVAGRETLQTTLLFDYVTRVRQQLSRLEQVEHTMGSQTQLRISGRTLGTLAKYCNELRTQSASNMPLEQQNVTLEQIRDVSELACEQVNEYIYLELVQLGDLDIEIQARVRQILIRSAGIAALILLVLAMIQVLIDRSISKPIETLVKNTGRLAEGDFAAHVENKSVNEITVLNESFNVMVEKLQCLMREIEDDTRTREQLELRLMQEQINPHFLYNTLEIIIWLAESGDKDSVVRIVQSLSCFFRVVLSEGRSNILIKEELDCIRSYLYIQHMRYKDIMRYEIEADDQVLNCEIQKLTLQPLVENALYHGIKNKRGRGTIHVRTQRSGNVIDVTVSDNGCGMSADRLARLRQSLVQKTANDSGFGLSNIQKRIQLAYGPSYGIKIDSSEGAGTVVTLHLPAIPEEN